MNVIWVVFVLSIFALFVLSYSKQFRKPPETSVELAVRTLRHAVYFAPAIAGGDGFGLPAPFFIAAPINATYPTLLPVLVLAPFAATWLFLFWLRYPPYRVAPPSSPTSRDDNA